jgi:hypothetical protein
MLTEYFCIFNLKIQMERPFGYFRVGLPPCLASHHYNDYTVLEYEPDVINLKVT